MVNLLAAETCEWFTTVSQLRIKESLYQLRPADLAVGPRCRRARYSPTRLRHEGGPSRSTRPRLRQTRSGSGLGRPSRPLRPAPSHSRSVR